MNAYKILIVDDEKAVRFGIRSFFEAKNCEVVEAEDCSSAEKLCLQCRPDFAILDLRLPDGDAIGLMSRFKEIDPALPVIILTGHGSIDLAVKAVKEGAEHFMTKPVELPTLYTMVERAIELQRTCRKRRADQAKSGRDDVDPFLGQSDAIKRLAEQARRVLSFDSPVLIQGLTGTGKGVLAAWIHNNSPRAEESFVDLNCAGLSREFLETELFGHEKGAFTGAVASKVGLLDVAHRGTFFLDEIGDMDPQVQAKLLKVLEEKRFRRLGDTRDRRVDIRLIAATHRPLDALVNEGRFRSDLYFRISTIPLYVPSLQERAEDIIPLAYYLLKRIGCDMGQRVEIELTLDAQAALKAYRWPGNIRELKNVLERAVLLGNSRALTSKDLLLAGPLAFASECESADLSLSTIEMHHIEKVLRQQKGHVEAASRLLKVPRSTLYEKLKKYGIDPSRL